MPTYAYVHEEFDKCTEGEEFEVSQSINDPKLEECPSCGKKIKRIISAGVGVKFKGTGWTPKFH